MNAEPEEQMRGSGQIIRVVNDSQSLGRGHSSGPKARSTLVSVDVCTQICLVSLSSNATTSLC